MNNESVRPPSLSLFLYLLGGRFWNRVFGSQKKGTKHTNATHLSVQVARMAQLLVLLPCGTLALLRAILGYTAPATYLQCALLPRVHSTVVALPEQLLCRDPIHRGQVVAPPEDETRA